MGGEWRITQQPPHGTPATGAGRGYRVETIPTNDPQDAPITTIGLQFRTADGRHSIYPWASIVRAEYVPDPADDQ